MKKKILVIFLICVFIIFTLSLVVSLAIFPHKYKNYVLLFSKKYDLESALVYAIIKQESDFDTKAVSKSGALGLMQLLPSTAKWIAEELGLQYSVEILFEPEYNINFGCFYLNYLFTKFSDIDVVICAYNAGEGKVLDWLENGKLNENKIDYWETSTYLKKVRGYYNVYKKFNIAL